MPQHMDFTIYQCIVVSRFLYVVLRVLFQRSYLMVQSNSLTAKVDDACQKKAQLPSCRIISNFWTCAPYQMLIRVLLIV